MKKKYILICLWWWLGLFEMQAQQSIEVLISRDTVGISQRFTISVNLVNLEGSVVFPKFDYFRVVSGPNQSSSKSLVNGTYSSRHSQSIDLVPIQEGASTIPPITIQTQDGMMYTDPFPITIVPQSNTLVNEVQPKQVYIWTDGLIESKTKSQRKIKRL